MNPKPASFYSFTIPGLRCFGMTEGALAIVAPHVLTVVFGRGAA